MPPFSSVSRLVLASLSLAIRCVSSSYVRLAVAGFFGWPPSHRLRLGPSSWRSRRHHCRRSGAEGSVHRPEAGQSAFSVLSCGSPPIVFVLVSPVVFSHEEASSPTIWSGGFFFPHFIGEEPVLSSWKTIQIRRGKIVKTNRKTTIFCGLRNKLSGLRKETLPQGRRGAFRPPPDAPSAMRDSRPE